MTAAEANSPEQFLALAKGTHVAGLILIYSSAALDLAVKRELNTLATEGFFDLSGEHLPTDDHAALEQILPKFASLRVRSASSHPDQVN